MVAGNVKCALSAGIKVSVPSVVDGPGYTLHVCGVKVVCESGFETREGPFWVTVLESPATN